jgi:hypothetical protein
MRKLTKSEWGPYCARISRGLEEGQRAEIEIVSLDSGDQYEARWMPLHGIAYDDKSNMIEIVLEGVDHMIREPSALLVETTRRGIVALEIVSGDEQRQSIRLSEPLRLPFKGERPGRRARRHGRLEK